MWSVIISVLGAVATSAITTKFLMEQHFKIIDEYTSGVCNETKRFVKKVEEKMIRDIKELKR